MAVTLNERTTIKRLVCIGNNQTWVEDIDVSAGTMIELNIASGGGVIDTSDQLNVFEAFQKVFIVNGSYLRVADFVNIKLTHAQLGTAHAKGDILTQNTTNKMIVDFTSSDKKATYGYVTAGTFDVVNEVTGSGSGTAFTPTSINGMLTHGVLAVTHTAGDVLTQAGTGAKMTVEVTDTAKTHTWGKITLGTFNTSGLVTSDGAGSSFTPTATDISPPVWHGWTVYPGGNSGTMPAKAYLGCLYRGRCVLSGNPHYPHQWYMSKIGDPWDWVYDSEDPLTAVAGNNTDAGEIGDIVRALIPYKDDYLIFGCASTIWVLTGDPAHGGSINEVDLTVGMFGANSWCFDGDGNLYFFGTNGIYKSPLGFRSVENISEINLPNLVDDEDVNPLTHRITMEYDRKRGGLVICITKLSDGSNSNYFYHLKLGAFYSESYPNECGAYSLFYYAANDNDYADLLIGGKDGYIRKFTSASKDDDAGASGDTAISSYTVWPIKHLARDNDREGKLTSLTIELAGGRAITKLTHTALTTAHAKGDVLTQATSGATMIVDYTDSAKENTFGYSTTGTFDTTYQVTGSGSGTAFTPSAVGTGAFSDTDGLSYEIHTGEDAETVLEKIKDGAAPFSSGTLSNSGRKNRIRTKVRGAYLGLKFLNSTASETWAINRIYGDVKEVGRIR